MAPIFIYIVVVVIILNFFMFPTRYPSLKRMQVCFKFCEDVPWIDPTKFVKMGVVPLFLHGNIGDFVQFCANS